MISIAVFCLQNFICLQIKYAIFNTNCAISSDTHAQFLRGSITKDKSKQIDFWNYLRRRWIDSIFVICWPITASRGFWDKRISSDIYITFIGSFFHCACITFRDMKHLESSESTQWKSQSDRPSPEIPHKSGANRWRLTSRVCDVEGGAVCSKNNKFGYR